jgi:DNA repair protein RecO (recombination protein O)
VLDHLTDAHAAAASIVRFELQMLKELGFGLDLKSCAATGQLSELDYVSPKSGRAVSRSAGESWRDRLLRLPAFMAGEAGVLSQDLSDGFALTGFFLTRHVLEPRGLQFTEARERFIATAIKQLSARTA